MRGYRPCLKKPLANGRLVGEIFHEVVRMQKQSTWNKMVHAPFKKVVAFDLLCMTMGMPIGAGIATAFLTGDIYTVLGWLR